MAQTPQIERFADLAAAIQELPSDFSTRLVGIDGCGGAGKSVFAERLSKNLDDAPIIHTDDFASWDNPIDWWPRLNQQVIEPLSQGKDAHWQRYDWGQRELAEWQTIAPGEVVIVEGVTATRKEWRDKLAYCIWVDCPRDVRLKRGLARDGQEASPQWRQWMAAEDKYVQDQRPQDHADLVVAGAPDVAHQEDEFARADPAA
jgi:uridine kinase